MHTIRPRSRYTMPRKGSVPARERLPSFTSEELIGGKYRLLGPIARGGMGVLWIAHNEALDVDVAIKVIRPDVYRKVGEAAIERLLLEARALARVGHPAIVRMIDYGQTPTGEPYLVMELLEGESLLAALDRRGRMGPVNAVRVLLPIAHALACAHEKGIVHRDVKPENILLSPIEDGILQPKLIDFGVAKLALADRDKRLTDDGAVVGSPAYVSPEAARGDGSDAIGDIWSLAVVLYELVTGMLPFDGENYHALLRAIIEREPMPIAEHGVEDDELWALISRGLEKDRAKRWPSMRSFGQALAEWLLARDIADDICGGALETIWMRRTLTEVGPAEASLEVVPTSQRARTTSQESPPPPAPRASVPSFNARESGDVSRSPGAGRCELLGELVTGSTATIHVGRMRGAGGFAKTVAVKRLRPRYAMDPGFAAMLFDEARVLSRIQHPNVVSTVDVMEEGGQLGVVMELVEGVSLADLLAEAESRDDRPPLGVVLRIMSNVLRGLHAAHEARDANGRPLGLVHRDVSPDNVLVGTDGHARVLDFGVARALGTRQSSDGHVKGKVGYKAPELVTGGTVARAADVFAASVVLWEALSGAKLFARQGFGATLHRLLYHPIEPPSRHAADVPPSVDDIVVRGLAREPIQRWETAAAMAAALERTGKLATEEDVGAWVSQNGGEKLARLRALVAEAERTPLGWSAEPSPLPPAPAELPTPPPSLLVPVAAAPRTRLMWIGGIGIVLLLILVGVLGLAAIASVPSAASAAPSDAPTAPTSPSE